MKNRRVFSVISFVMVGILLICAVPLIAKYITNTGEQHEITSTNFYFSSNFLKSDDVPTYEIYGNTVTFAVRNYIDRLRVNATDITFTVSADSGRLNVSSGSLERAVPSSENITLFYDFAEKELQKEITVSVTGTGDFTQTLKAKFILIKTDSLRYEIKDWADRDYAELYIYTGNTESNVTMTWDKAQLLIDETNDYIFGNITLNDEKNSVTVTDIPADTTVKILNLKNFIM